MEMVRSKTGAAIADDFRAAVGTPIVVDQTPTTGRAYFMDSGDTICEVGGVLSSQTISGALTVSGLISADGGQIKFPATQNPSANANTLDDYEEGSWTPVDSSGAALSFAAAAGTYTKIGRLVTLQATVVYPATADGSNAIIGGLPFTISASNSCAICYCTDATATVALGAATTVLVALVAAAGAAARTNANLSGDTVVFTLTHEV